MQLSFKWLDTSWKSPQLRALEQVIIGKWAKLWYSAQLALILTQSIVGNSDKPTIVCTKITQSGHQRATPISASICVVSFQISEVRCLAVDSSRAASSTMTTIIMVMGWSHAMFIVHPRHEDQN